MGVQWLMGESINGSAGVDGEADVKPILAEAEDYRAELRTLFELLKDADDAAWEEPTRFKGWTAVDVLGHLHMFDRGAEMALRAPEELTALLTGYREGVRETGSGRAYTRRVLGDPKGPELRDRWRAFGETLADQFRNVEPQRRLPWAGPTMSARSCISARQMETWAHGQALFDLLGQERQDQDRIRNIAVLGVNTFEWAFKNRGLEAPEKPFVKLTAPSGLIWTWNDPGAASSVEGSAVEFCQVVAQTRHVDDTALVVRGEAAQAWMPIAQCFAGPPENPPAPGVRKRDSWPR